MAKKEKPEEALVQEPVTPQEPQVPQTPNRDAWRSGIMKKNPELGENPSDEELYAASMNGYDAEHELNKKNAADNGRIYDAMNRYPEVAGFISALANPEEGALPEEALAAFGEDLMEIFTNKPAYREKIQAKRDAESKKAELDKAAGEAFVAACEELGRDPESTSEEIAGKYGEGGAEGEDFRVSKAFYIALIKSLTYDDDMLAAEARGRSQQIQSRKDARGSMDDGISNTTAGGGQSKPYDPTSVAALAEKRRRMTH